MFYSSRMHFHDVEGMGACSPPTQSEYSITRRTTTISLYWAQLYEDAPHVHINRHTMHNETTWMWRYGIWKMRQPVHQRRVIIPLHVFTTTSSLCCMYNNHCVPCLLLLFQVRQASITPYQCITAAGILQRTLLHYSNMGECVKRDEVLRRMCCFHGRRSVNVCGHKTYSCPPSK